MTGLTRQQAAEAVAALFGTSARQTHESTVLPLSQLISSIS